MKNVEEKVKFRDSVSTKFLLMIVSFILLTSTFVGFYQIWQNEKDSIIRQTERLNFEVERASRDLERIVEDSARSVIMLAGTPPIEGISDARRAATHDLTAPIREAIWKDRLAQIFLSLAQSNQYLLQIRLIETNGMELIRVNREGEHVFRVGREDLQNKGTRRYVTETLASEDGKIRFFGIDLNKEHGKVDPNHTPVMRVATMVSGDDGTLLGLIVINVDIGKAVKKLAQSFSNEKFFMLIDDKGDYLYHPDQSKIFELALGKETGGLREDYPELARTLEVSPSDKKEVGIAFQNDKYLANVKKFHFEKKDLQHFVLAVAITPMDALLSENRLMQRQIMLYTAILSLIGAIIAFFVTRHLIKPLQQLTEATQKLSIDAVDNLMVDGKDRKDEIGVMLRSVHHMATSLEEKQQNIRAILVTAQNPILTIDDRGIIKDVNGATCKLFGYSLAEMSGKNISMLMNSHDKQHHNKYLQQHRHGKPSSILDGGREVIGRKKDGSSVPIHLAVSKIKIKDRIFFTGIMTDLTDLKKVDKLKSEFVSTVSHELRTPLTSIKGALDIIKVSLDDSFPETIKKMLLIASSNSVRLARLIDDILDVEKIEAGKLAYDFEEIEVASFLQRVVETNQAYAEQHHTSYHLECDMLDAKIRADQSRLEQVLANLLSNAAKFSPPGGIINVRANRKGNAVQISVQDFGNGIPEEFRDKIFTKFAQADSSDTRTKGGTGLGLAIAREIVKAHDSSLQFETDTGHGTTFFFKMPLLGSEENGLTEASSSEQASKEPERPEGASNENLAQSA
nr:ATP-binding protein [uncultured Cohaesibacter sp.]